MEGTPPVKFTGFKNNDEMIQSFYQKLNQGRDVSMDDYLDPAASKAILMNNSNTTSVTACSVGSNSRTPILVPGGGSGSSHLNPWGSFAMSVFHPNKLRRNLNDDALAKLLMDSNYPTESALENYEDWTVDLKKLILAEAFAEGSFGRVFKGKYEGEDVAIKILERADNMPDLDKQFRQEVEMLITLKHPNIVRFIGTCRKSMVGCIVTEYAKGGSIRQFLEKRKRGPMPLKLTIRYALDVARGMSYIHEHGFIHRDLKSGNLLIATDKTIKIADFGLARVEAANERMTPDTGTFRWMAPEIILNLPYTRKVDVYSFGIVLWELITGLLPYEGKSGVDVANSVVYGGRPDIPKDCIPLLREIMTCCWDSEPDVRPHFPQIIEMLRDAETQIMTTARKALFRCCSSQPMIID